MIKISNKTVNYLKKKRLTVSFAESCTGGLLSSAITSVNGSSEKKDIREFVNNFFLAKDVREFRNYYSQVTPDVDMDVELIDSDGEDNTIKLPIELGFFWPDS